MTERGRLMAAVLACGSTALLSHRSAAFLWGLSSTNPREIEVVVPAAVGRRQPGIRIHRQRALDPPTHPRVDGIPVTNPTWTLVDLAGHNNRNQLERAVNEADRLDLIDPESLRVALESEPRRPGVGALRALLDRPTFALTDSALERSFLPLAHSAGLPPPETQAKVNGFRVDFYWPQLGLVVETDGLRYHRTASQQTKDQHRDQAHVVAGLTALRFSAAQVRFEPDYVRATLSAVASRLGDG